jgi:hypothetical protein
VGLDKGAKWLATEIGGKDLESTRIVLLRHMQSPVVVLSPGRYDFLEVTDGLVVAVCWLLHRELASLERRQEWRGMSRIRVRAVRLAHTGLAETPHRHSHGTSIVRVVTITITSGLPITTPSMARRPSISKESFQICAEPGHGGSHLRWPPSLVTAVGLSPHVNVYAQMDVGRQRFVVLTAAFTQPT